VTKGAGERGNRYVLISSHCDSSVAAALYQTTNLDAVKAADGFCNLHSSVTLHMGQKNLFNINGRLLTGFSDYDLCMSGIASR